MRNRKKLRRLLLRGFLLAFPEWHRRQYSLEMMAAFEEFETEIESDWFFQRWHRRARCFMSVLYNGWRLRLAGPGASRGGRRQPDPIAGGPMDAPIHDFRYAFRRILRRPVFSMVAVAVLGLGIGANTAAFNFLETLLWKPLPLPGAERVVRLTLSTPGGSPDSFSYPDYRDVRDRTRAFDALAAHRRLSAVLGEGRDRFPLQLELVSGNYFEVLGLPPLLGRVIEVEDDAREGSGAVVVLSESLWRTRFGGRPDILGQSVKLNGTRLEVVGILPAGFAGTYPSFPVGAWVPLAMHDAIRAIGATRENRNWGWLEGTGRMARGIDFDQARADLARISTQLANEHPGQFGERRFTIRPGRFLPEGLQEPVAFFLGILAVVSGLILVATCTNVAGVILSRSLERTRELAICRSLGAGRWSLVRQMLAESVLLTAGGALASLLAARWIQRGLLQLLSQSELQSGFQPRLELDLRTLFFTLLISLLVSVTLGIVPALKSFRVPLLAAMKSEAEGATSGHGRSRAFGAFVVAQVAVSLVLLVGTGLMVRTVLEGTALDLGFESGDLWLANLDLRNARLDSEARGRFLKSLMEELGSLPRVKAVSLAQKVPLDGTLDRQGFRIEGFEPSAEAARVPVNLNVVAPGYFELMEIPVHVGRAFEPADSSPGAAPVAVVNQEFVRRYWPGQDPIGRTLESSGLRFQVVGVVGNVSYYALGESPQPMVFGPSGTVLGWPSSLHIRTLGVPARFESHLVERLARLNPEVHLARLSPFQELRRILLLPQRALATAASMFGMLALTLTLIGLYAMVSSSVVRRTREIGIRMALGGGPGGIQRMILRHELALILTGIALGLLAAAVLTRFLAGILIGVSPLDVPSYLGGAGIMILVTLLAGLIPARRATRIDPVRCLRFE